MPLSSPLPRPQIPSSSSGNEHGAGSPSGQPAEAWQEFDTDPAALNSAALNRSFIFPNMLHVSSKPASCRAIPDAMSIALCCAESEAEEGSGAAAVQRCCSSSQRCLGRQLRLPSAPLTQGNSQIKLFPLLPGSVFPYCCSALKARLVLEVSLPRWGNYCRFPPCQDFTDPPSKLAGAGTSQFIFKGCSIDARLTGDI